MKKILFLLEAFDKGGIEKVTLDIVNNLDPNKYDITVYTIWNGGTCQSLVNKNVKVRTFFPRYIRGAIRLVINLPSKLVYRLFIRGRYDVEIAAGDGIPARVIRGSTNKNSKKIAWIHMDVEKRGSNLKELKNPLKAKKFYSKFNKIICVSEDTKRSFNNKFGYEEKTVVKYNPIPKDEILKKSIEHIDFIVNEQEINFVTVGRLVEQKGYKRLLRIINRLVKEGYKLKLNIIGEGIEKQELEKYIRENNLESTVKLWGFQMNPYKFMKHSDMYICSSTDEALSTVIIESIIIGLPVLTTECNGMNEILEYGKYGKIVENSEEALYEEMKKILLNKQVIKDYRQNIKNEEIKFELNNSIRELEKVWE